MRDDQEARLIRNAARLIAEMAHEGAPLPAPPVNPKTGTEVMLWQEIQIRIERAREWMEEFRWWSES